MRVRFTAARVAAERERKVNCHANGGISSSQGRLPDEIIKLFEHEIV